MEKVDLTPWLDWMWAKQMEQDVILEEMEKQLKIEHYRNVTLS